MIGFGAGGAVTGRVAAADGTGAETGTGAGAGGLGVGNTGGGPDGVKVGTGVA